VRLQAFGVDATDQDHHPDDLHQVFRSVHAQPRRVDVGNLFRAPSSQLAPGENGEAI
jgi:hypothetical protein